jgi:hypothetical protein
MYQSARYELSDVEEGREPFEGWDRSVTGSRLTSRFVQKSGWHRCSSKSQAGIAVRPKATLNTLNTLKGAERGPIFLGGSWFSRTAARRNSSVYADRPRLFVIGHLLPRISAEAIEVSTKPGKVP